MAKIYALSDVHGHLNELKEALRNVDLDSNLENKLILLGDYIDGDKNSCEVLCLIKAIQESYGNQVEVLLGNHEVMFLDWVFGENDELEWLSEDEELCTTKSFLSDEQFNNVIKELELTDQSYDAMSKLFKKVIYETQCDLLNWLKHLPRYYETDNQIFVHAGIDEEASEHWKLLTSDDDLVGKFPPVKGRFYKDIIAGHVGTSTFGGHGFHGIYWDKESHYYIDGTVGKSGKINVLGYDTESGEYSYL